MANDPRLAALVRISGLVKDIRLADLRRAEAERQTLLDRMAALAEPPAMPADLPAPVAQDVALRYERWAELRRREIAQALQHKAAECEKRRAEARVAVGRDGALGRITQRS
jgi:hypothetical protein